MEQQLFGNYTILSNVRHQLEKEPDWYWEFKPVTSEQEHNLYSWYMKESPTWLPIAWRHLAISFGGTNIPKSPKDKEPVLARDASEDAVLELVKKMPYELIEELWKACGEANPQLGPPKPEDTGQEKPGTGPDGRAQGE